MPVAVATLMAAIAPVAPVLAVVAGPAMPVIVMAGCVVLPVRSR